MAVPLRSGLIAAPPRHGSRPEHVSTYREFRPSAAITDACVCNWEGWAGWDRTLRVLPDGCIDLIWNGQRLYVAASPTLAVRHRLRAGAWNVGVRLQPGAAGAILGWPVQKLPTVLDLEDLWEHLAHLAADALAHTSEPAAQRALLERLVAERLDAGHMPDRLVIEAAQQLRAPAANVESVARAQGLSSRELRRRFQHHVGCGPKTLQRVLRFQRFLGRVNDLASGRLALATIASELGYADQAHLSRECVRLSGSSPRSLLARWHSAR